ncbi:MAG: MlaD family protein [Nocardioides sp.]|uniref:MCE family protein n=1 Tax=Nocardioides sp. TaxID=35761 RepID=UPI0039E2EBCD
MITRRTKIQLVIFVLITLVGVSFVGARYARLGTLFVSDHYTVTVHLASSGGIYTGGEVDYRGVKIGQVGDMTLTDSGVDVALDIGKSWDEIPADSRAVVANRSAVGEQYVDLQPQTDNGPYLHDSSQIAQQRTETPIATEKLLGDAATTVDSVDKKALTTTISELGKAFEGTGTDLQQILDTGTAFIRTANDNIDVTTDLIRDSNTVLSTQLDSADDIRSFSRDLSLFTKTLAGSNKDLLRLIKNGTAAANQVQAFLEENDVDLSELLSEVLTTGKIVQRHLPGLRQLLVVYPYVVEGGFSVLAKGSDGYYDAHFGLVLTTTGVCHQGYNTKQRTPQDTSDKPMNTKARCTEPASESNARGAQNAPRAKAAYRAPVVATYDTDSDTLSWGSGSSTTKGTKAPSTYGSDTWKWLYLEPLSAGK